MADRFVQDCLDEFHALAESTERVNVEDVWGEIRDNVVPHRTGFEDEPEKGKRSTEVIIYDGTALAALNLYASGSQGYLLSSSFKWFGLRVPEERLMDVREVRMWLSYVEQVLYGLIQRSNFYKQIYELFRDGGSFGTADLYSWFDRANSREWFMTLHPREIYIAENDNGEVDTVYQHFRMSAKRVWDAFREDELHEETEKMADDPQQRHKDIQLLRVVKPNEGYDPRRADRRAKRYGSWHIDLTHEHLMRESGHDVIPDAIWRVEKASDELYGRGPGWTALGDIKALYAYAKTDITAAQWEVDPAWDIPAERANDLALQPGGRNFYEEAGREIRQIRKNSNLRAGLDREERKQQIIEKHYLVDFFLMMAQAEREMTATEIRQRREEKAVILGPHITGLNQDVLDRVIDRVFSDAWEMGLIPPAPEILLRSGQGRLEVDYMGPLAQAQRAHFHTEPYRQSLSDIAGIVQILIAAQQRPMIIDNFNWDFIAREMAKAAGMPEEAMLDERMVQALRRAIAQQQQAQEMAARMEQLGKAVPGLNEPIQEGSILGGAGQETIPAVASGVPVAP